MAWTQEREHLLEEGSVFWESEPHSHCVLLPEALGSHGSPASPLLTPTPALSLASLEL